MKHPVIRYHGGKFRLAPWVIQHFPAHRCYVEPYGGAAGVLIQKGRAYAEVYNDVDGDIVNLFRVLQCPRRRAKLTELLVLTPYARAEFELASKPVRNSVERARRTVVRSLMGFGSAGATKGATGFRIDTRRKHGTAQDIWRRYPDVIGTIGERLAGVLIENRPAIEVIKAHDEVDTLHYIDPPYPHETRVRGAQYGRYYRHEMTHADHRELLDVLLNARGMVALSTYANAMYSEALQGWALVEKRSRISAGRGTTTRVEQLWLNPACQHGSGLFNKANLPGVEVLL